MLVLHGPRVEALTELVGLLSDLHLFHPEPFVGSAFGLEKAMVVGRLKSEIHLEAAVIAVSRVCVPRAFMGMNEFPAPLVRWVLRASLGTLGT